MIFSDMLLESGSLGTGYAYWTDTLNVTTKATAGDFAVTFADMGLYAQYGSETLPGGWSIVDGIGEAGFADDEFFMRGKEYNKIAKDGSIEAYGERAEGHNNVDFNAELVDAAAINEENDDADSQKKGVKISTDFLWDQFNVGKDTVNPNILVNQNAQ